MASLPSGDDSTRFCSTRCREAYDAGFPVWDESAELYGHRLTPPLTGWRVIAGPPGTVGSNPWQSVIDASERKRRKIEKRKMRKIALQNQRLPGAQVTNRPMAHLAF